MISSYRWRSTSKCVTTFPIWMPSLKKSAVFALCRTTKSKCTFPQDTTQFRNLTALSKDWRKADSDVINQRERHQTSRTYLSQLHVVYPQSSRTLPTHRCLPLCPVCNGCYTTRTQGESNFCAIHEVISQVYLCAGARLRAARSSIL